jgi:2'-5' RNA ligase
LCKQAATRHDALMHRLFVAIEIPEPAADGLLDIQAGLRGARWTASENFHLTLAFIGETDRHGFRDAATVLGTIDAPSFEMRLNGCGFFGDRKPRALWVGVDAPSALVQLQARIASALRRGGFDVEKRKFAPHVTFAWLAGAARDDVARFCAGHGLFSAGPFAVEAFHLYESRLGAEGAHYEIAQTYPLAPI